MMTADTFDLTSRAQRALIQRIREKLAASAQVGRAEFTTKEIADLDRLGLGTYDPATKKLVLDIPSDRERVDRAVKFWARFEAVIERLDKGARLTEADAREFRLLNMG